MAGTNGEASASPQATRPPAFTSGTILLLEQWVKFERAIVGPGTHFPLEY